MGKIPRERDGGHGPRKFDTLEIESRNGAYRDPGAAGVSESTSTLHLPAPFLSVRELQINPSLWTRVAC